MLIAIMGDTFDKVTEKRKQAALYEKIQIIDDYIDLIRISPSDEKQFVYSVSPIDKEDSQDVDWEGKVASIKRNVVAEVEATRNDTKKTVKGMQ